MLTWWKRNNLWYRYVHNINSVNDQVSNSKEKTSITVSIAKLDGGTTESHGETRRQPTSSEKWWWSRFPGQNSRKSTGCRQDTHSQHTSVQYSLFTSAERIARAWLKTHGLQCHLCAPEKSLVIWCCTCLTLCCFLTCRVPRTPHLPHSLFLLLQQNTQHNWDNTIYSKNTQYVMHISKLSQSTSNAIKNHSGVKTCRVAETRARQLHRNKGAQSSQYQEKGKRQSNRICLTPSDDRSSAKKSKTTKKWIAEIKGTRFSRWNVSGKPDAECLGTNSKGYDSLSLRYVMRVSEKKKGPSLGNKCQSSSSAKSLRNEIWGQVPWRDCTTAAMCPKQGLEYC